MTVLALALVLLAAPPSAEPKKISRRDAIALGVSRNYDLLGKRLEARRLEVLGRAAWKPYSPTVFLDARYRQTPLGAPGTDRFVDYTAGASWRSILGTTIGAQVDVNQSLPGSPTPYGNELSLTLTQPLLKDAWLAGAALPLREAELTAAIQRELYRGELNALISAIDAAYWDLALAESDFSIKSRSRDRAKAQYDDTAENIRRGIIADVEIYIVEENVVFFEQELLRTAQVLTAARRRLAELLALEPDALLAAEDTLSKPAITAPPRAAFVARGLDASPAILAQQHRVALAGARSGYAFNQALPALNVNAALGLFRYSTPEATVGLAFALPLDRWAIGSALDNARMDAERAQLELQNQQAKVRFELENALTELELNVRQLTLATKRVELAELKLAAQSDKYKSGISTLADVVRFQRDLDEALIASQRVIRAVQVGQSKLLATQGTLADSVGVEVR